jgi:hypothetical protein
MKWINEIVTSQVYTNSDIVLYVTSPIISPLFSIIGYVLVKYEIGRIITDWNIVPLWHGLLFVGGIAFGVFLIIFSLCLALFTVLLLASRLTHRINE